jgi:foldase protein PrsA
MSLKLEQKNKKRNILGEYMRKVSCVFLLILFVTSLAACGVIDEELTGMEVVINYGFDETEVFRLDTLSCSKPEMNIYIADMQKQYEEVFGSDFWDYMNTSGETMDVRLKENVLANTSQIKAMNLLAIERGIVLDEEELANAKTAADSYYLELEQGQIDALEINLEVLEIMYQEYALAGKVYSHIIKDINPEISDDEARTIVVQNIFLKTYSVNGLGERMDYSDEKKLEVYYQAVDITKQLEDGADFKLLSLEYSDDDSNEYLIGKGDTESAYEEIAFSLSEDEISGIVETDSGYYIIQCISSFDLEETQRNKVTIIKEQKKEVFEAEYLDFVQDLPKVLNEELWDELDLIPSENLPDSSFVEIYQQYFDLVW